MEAAFPLINRCNSIRPFLVSSMLILGSIGDGKDGRTALTLLPPSAVFSFSLSRLDGGFIPGDNSYNTLNR